MNKYYEKDGITIYNGDSLEILDSLYTKVNLVLTDPPYGVNYQNNYTHHKQDKIHGDEKDFSYTSWTQKVYRLLKDNSAFFSFSGWSTYPCHYLEIEKCGLSMKEPIIVQKRASGTTDLYGSFQTNSDWVIFAHKGRFKFKKTNLIRNKKAGTIPNKGRKPVPEFKTRLPSAWFGEKFPWSTENPSSVKKWRHPTIKGVEFLKWLILISTDRNDTIIDPFLGSGSTLIAAKELERKAIGIELEEKYCDMAIERLSLI